MWKIKILTKKKTSGDAVQLPGFSSLDGVRLPGLIDARPGSKPERAGGQLSVSLRPGSVP